MAKTQPICYCLRNDAIERHLCIRIWWFSDDGKASAWLIYVLSSLDLKFMTHCLNQCYQVVNWLDWRTECCANRKLMLTTGKSLNYCHLTRFLQFIQLGTHIVQTSFTKTSSQIASSQLIYWRTECCEIWNGMLTTGKLLNYCYLKTFFQFIQL